MIKTISLILILLYIQDSTSVNTLIPYCKSIPYNPITNCNLTCSSCQSKNICLSCPSYLNLTGVTCNVPTSKKKQYYSYFHQHNQRSDKNLSLFLNANGILTDDDDIYQFCIAGLYRFDIIGLFTSTDQLKYIQTFYYQQEFIDISFRLFFSTSIAILKIQLNSQVVYNNTFNPSFQMNMTSGSQTDQNNLVWNIGKLQNDPSAYVDTIFVPIRTGMLKLNSKSMNIRITVQDGQINYNNANKFWGISQINILSQQCSSCVTDFLYNLGNTLGIVIGVSAGLVILMVSALVYYQKSLQKARDSSSKLKDTLQKVKPQRIRSNNRLISMKLNSKKMPAQ